MTVTLHIDLATLNCLNKREQLNQLPYYNNKKQTESLDPIITFIEEAQINNF